MAANKFAVIGLGQFGRAIATKLTRKGAEVLAIDSDDEIIDEISGEVTYAVALDATDKKALVSQNIQDFDAVIVAIGNNFEQLLLCSVILLELNVKRIISRAIGPYQRTILQKVGIKEVLIPEREIATMLTEKLLNPNIISYLQLPDKYRIVEIKAPEGSVGRTIGDLDLRDRYNLSLITLSKEKEVIVDGKVVLEEHIDVPGHDTILNDDDFLLVFGKQKDIDRFIEVNQ